MDTNTKIILKFLDFAGLQEIAGPKSDPAILQFYKDAGNSWVTDETVPWCSAMMNAVMKSLGFPYTKNLAARSWENWGNKTLNPIKGDVVVFWRTSLQSNEGHVGIYLRETSTDIVVLGGNQGDMVNISLYPKSQLLTYRTLRDVSQETPKISQKPFPFDIQQTLRKGMRNSQVKTLQMLLKSFRSDLINTIDGDFGSKTETAVKAFQKAKGLSADGVVGTGTIAQLRVFYDSR